MLNSCSWMAPLGRSADVILRHLPMGAAWDAFRTGGKRGWRMITGFAGAYEDVWAALCNLATELNPQTTTALLPDWERALGLPDPCLPPATTLDQRRALVMFRLTKRRWNTGQSWQDLAALYGLTIDVTPGTYVVRPDDYPVLYPKKYESFPRAGRFRVYVDVTNVRFTGYAYGGTGFASGSGYPIPYGGQVPAMSAFMCFINRVVPANVVVLWNQFPNVIGVCTQHNFHGEFSSEFC